MGPRTEENGMGGGTTAKARSAGIADAEQVAARLADFGAPPKRGDDLTCQGPQPVHALLPTRIPHRFTPRATARAARTSRRRTASVPAS
ncbi:hypothetical protein MCBG_06090 [Micromonospora sp. M42]|nr:conserved hypothetical protein [Streptomyces sp. SPB78]EWM62822.1 hypothetical protein MCBG_06090 [Micromonospora sp. M42]